MDSDPAMVDDGRTNEQVFSGETVQTKPAVEKRLTRPVSVTSDGLHTGNVNLTLIPQLVVPFHPDRLRVALLIETGTGNFVFIDGQRNVTNYSFGWTATTLPAPPVYFETRSAIYAIGQGRLSWVAETRTTPKLVMEPDSRDGRSS